REYVRCGCFEFYGSGNGIAKHANMLRSRRAGRNLPVLTAEDVFDAYKRKDRVARKVLGQAIDVWGMAVANLVSLFNPEKIVFGGGVFGPAAQFLPEIRAEAERWAQPVAMKKVKLLRSRLGTDAALYGAAWLALRHEDEASEFR